MICNGWLVRSLHGEDVGLVAGYKKNEPWEEMALLFLLGFSNVCLSSSNVIYTFCFACMFFIYVIYLGWVFEELTQAFSKYATEFHQIIRLPKCKITEQNLLSKS